MRRKWAIAFGLTSVLLLLIGAVFYASSLLRWAALLTTADPNALGLIATASRQPVTLGMHVTKEFLASQEAGEYLGRTRPADHRINFILPAAYVTVVDLKDKPKGSQRLGFELWSRSFDPVMPDELEVRRLCPMKACPEGPVAKRRAGGEDAISIEVTSVIGTPARRRSVLGSLSGLERDGTTYAGRPCAIGYDAERDLVTIDKPPEVRSYGDACNFGGNGSLTWDGVHRVPRNFAKRDNDGSLRYIVRCGDYSDDPRAASRCEMQSYFGIWPLFLLVPSRIAEWDDLYTRVSDFLARHVASRTDLAMNTGVGK